MPFIYITGAPGSGKSTLQKELTKSRFEVYDIDSPQFGGAHNKASGEKVVIPPSEERTDNWFKQHEWRIYRDAFEKLKKESAEKLIIICGVAESDKDITDLFDNILYLKIDDDELTRRISTRTDNDYGKNDFELKEIMRRKHALDDRYTDSDNIHLVDASGTLNSVVNKIISHIQ